MKSLFLFPVPSLLSPFPPPFFFLHLLELLSCTKEEFWNASFPETLVGDTTIGNCLPGYSVYQDNLPVGYLNPERACTRNQTELKAFWETPSHHCEGLLSSFFDEFLRNNP